MKKLFLLLPILLLTACNLNEPQIEVEVISDTVEVAEEDFVCGRDKVSDVNGNDYKTAYFDVDGGHDVSKDGQCWMAENLNVGTVILNPGETPSDDGVIEKWCLDKSNEYCDGLNDKDKFGGLYTWGESSNYVDLKTQKGVVQGICPKGWHLPEYDDWLYVKNYFSQFLAGIANGVPNRMILKKNYGGFDLNDSRSLHRTSEYFVEGISKRLYLTGIMRDGDVILPAIFYVGDGYNKFVLRELEGATQSVRCVYDEKGNDGMDVGSKKLANEIQNIAMEVASYISKEEYKRNEKIMSYFRDEKLLYELYGFENHPYIESSVLQLDRRASRYLEDGKYVVAMKRRSYEDLYHDFNIGHKYFFVFENLNNQWQIVDVFSTRRDYLGDSYIYVGDIDYREIAFPFLENIFHMKELRRNFEIPIASEKDLRKFLKKGDK